MYSVSLAIRLNRLYTLSRRRILDICEVNKVWVSHLPLPRNAAVILGFMLVTRHAGSRIGAYRVEDESERAKRLQICQYSNLTTDVKPRLWSVL